LSPGRKHMKKSELMHPTFPSYASEIHKQPPQHMICPNIPQKGQWTSDNCGE
jgi:hypothetical protein